jgi:hypothetical protein
VFENRVPKGVFKHKRDEASDTLWYKACSILLSVNLEACSKSVCNKKYRENFSGEIA